MRSRVQKWGNSLGIRIPIGLATNLKLHSGSIVNLEIDNGQLVVRIPQYDLESMVEAITEENQHHQLLDDTQVGVEEW